VERERIKERILALIDEYSKRAIHGAKESVILQNLAEEGISIDEALELVRELNMEGRVFSPVVGYLRRLK